MLEMPNPEALWTPVPQSDTTRTQPKRWAPPGQILPAAKRTPIGPGSPPIYNRDSPTVRSYRDEEFQSAHQRMKKDESSKPIVDNAPVHVQPSTVHFDGNHPVGVYGAHPLGINIDVPEADPSLLKKSVNELQE